MARKELTPRQSTVRQFIEILALGGVRLHEQNGNRYIKWHHLPEFLWDAGLYIRVPREVVFTSPTQSVDDRRRRVLSAPWTDETAAIMQKAMDRGEVKVCHRVPEKPIVFEVFDEQGNIIGVGPWYRRDRHEHYAKGSRVKNPEGLTKKPQISISSARGAASLPEEDGILRQLHTDIHQFLSDLYLINELAVGGQTLQWKRLPMALACKRLYITGFPFECAPTIVDDKVEDASSPQYWDRPKCERFLLASRSNKINVVVREEERVVLFELMGENGTFFDSTLGYSQDWIHKYLIQQQPFPSSISIPASRPRTGPSFSFSSSTGRQRRSTATSFEERAKQKEHDKHMLLAPGGALGDKVMRRGRGWVIIEESTDEEGGGDRESDSDSMDLDQSLSADTSRPMSPSKDLQSQTRSNDDESEDGDEDESEDEDELDPDADIELDVHSEDESQHAGKWRFGEKKGQKIKSKKRGAPTPGKEARKMIRIAVSNQVMMKIAKFDIRGDGSEVTWTQFPQALARANKYITGFPQGGLPRIKDDKVVFQASHPSLWTGQAILEMKRILEENSFQCLPRPPGRIVICEVHHPDGTKEDATLGFTHDWLVINMPDSLFEAEKEEAQRRADELRVKAKAEADRQDRVRAERIKLAKAEQERAKITRREEREKEALERRESRDVLDHRSSLSNGSARPAPTPLDDSWRSDPDLWKEGGKILPWQTKGHDPPPGFVAPADWNPVGWKYVSGVWVNIPKVKAQQVANAASGGYSQRDSERAMKAEAKARVKAESDRARARAEMIAREREAGRRAADHISTVGAKVIPSRVADQPSSRALCITESKISTREKAAILAPSASHVPNNPALPTPVATPRTSFDSPPALPAQVVPPPLHPRQMLKQRKQGFSWADTTTTEPQSPIPGRDKPPPRMETTPPLPGLTPSRESSVQVPDPNGRRWPPPGVPKIDWTGDMIPKFQAAFTDFFGDHQLGSSKIPIPWMTLPGALAERRMYLAGVPHICAPLVKDDRIDASSLISNWAPEMFAAMYWAVTSGTLQVLHRTDGRRVLFELISGSGQREDSTLGYSKSWIDLVLPDTKVSKKPTIVIGSPTSSSHVGKRARSSSQATLSTNKFEEDEPDMKRRKLTDRPVEVATSVSADAPHVPLFQIRPARMLEMERAVSSSDNSNTSIEEQSDPSTLSLDRLLPNHLPPPLRKGRVYLNPETDLFEWTPPAFHSSSSTTSTVWNSTQGQWRLVKAPRLVLMERPVDERTGLPDRFDGPVLGRGDGVWKEESGTWEVQFPYRGELPGTLHWDDTVGRWQWIMHF